MNVQRVNLEAGQGLEAALRRRLEHLGYTVHRYVYLPGTLFAMHSHGVDKIDAVVSGSFKVSMGGETVVLEAGQFVFVPKGIEHEAEVVGDEPVVSLDGIRSR